MSKLAKSLLQIALNDIKASKLLYTKRFYAQSFFSFQQAAEKGFKAYGIIIEVLKEDKIKDIGHQHLKIYRKIIASEEVQIDEGLQNIKKLKAITKKDFPYSEHISNYKGQLLKEKSIVDKYIAGNSLVIDKIDVLKIIELLEEIDTTKFRVTKGFTEHFRAGMYIHADKMDAFQMGLGKEMIVELEKEGNFEELIEYFKLHINLQLKFYFITNTLYYCALVSMDHVSTSRYPDGNIEPVEFYNMQLPIVKYQMRYLRMLEKALRILTKLYFSENKEA